MGINPGVMIFSVKAIKEKKDVLKAMYRAYNRAVEYLNETSREDYINLVVDRGGFPEAAKVSLMLPRYRKAMLPTEKDVSEVVQWLRAKELVKKEYDFKTIIAEGCLP